ncbi:VOC family protein [Nocardioides anomalus]|uniref:VOC family protein n=1 Tax=Nocardioides anomalus TaxID=2712223 RepID=UPI001E4B818D|nr:VOC family protein [Nocardioides anomalus]
MPTLNPYLIFQGRAREAIEFYRDVFGGELNVMAFGDMGMTEHDGHPIDPNGVMHGQLETPDGFTLMCADTPMQDTPTPNDHISLSGDEAERLRGWFDRLAEGGTVDVPMEKAPWGDEFGQVKDRFGVNWLVNVAGSAQPEG